MSYVDVYLVRHALTAGNKHKQYIGHTDQACLPHTFHHFDRLKKEINALSWDNLYSSDLTRCRQTLHFLMGSQEEQVHFDARLRELHFGEWEGKAYAELQMLRSYQKWLADWLNESPPQGETGAQFQHRVDSFLLDMFQSVNTWKGKNSRYATDNQTERQSNILLVTHAGVIRYVLSHYFPEKNFWEWNMSHGQAYRLRFNSEKGGCSCLSWLVVPTLEKEKL